MNVRLKKGSSKSKIAIPHLLVVFEVEVDWGGEASGVTTVHDGANKGDYFNMRDVVGCGFFLRGLLPLLSVMVWTASPRYNLISHCYICYCWDAYYQLMPLIFIECSQKSFQPPHQKSKTARRTHDIFSIGGNFDLITIGVKFQTE